ncbi:MAG: acetyltransferase [Acidimicrobiales bacterium]|nr:acetyltransferase [Acidimicrobiales bacterium]
MVRTRDPAVVEWGAERARVAPWRGDPRLAYLAPLPEGPPPSTGFVRRCLERLASQGFTGVVTPALAPAEQRAFLLAGFDTHERLHLLAHDLVDLPPTTRGATRRARRGDRRAVLRLDQAAFSPFWRLDRAGLQEALEAVPSTRFRVTGDGPVTGYAVAGRAGPQGYLQRLAVHPDHQRGGRGRALVADALRWMQRRGAARAVVNTQLGNEAALSLYTGAGFRLQPSGLAVLRRELD